MISRSCWAFTEISTSIIPRILTGYDRILHNLHHHLLGSSIQAKQEQSVELLLLMVYTAAQTGSPRFIEMVFSTSAGQVVFNSYKDRNPLPEDVARANDHEELAQYLQDVHRRYCVKRNLGFQEVTLMCINYKAWLNKENNRKDFSFSNFKRKKSKRGNVN